VALTICEVIFNFRSLHLCKLFKDKEKAIQVYRL
jgi:hypothetical protein